MSPHDSMGRPCDRPTGRLNDSAACRLPAHSQGQPAGLPTRPVAGHLALANLRRHGRVLCQGVECELGVVLEVSASGMRVRAAHRPPPIDTVLDLVVRSAPATFALRVRVSWDAWVGGADHEVGLEFLELTDTAQRGLLEIVHSSIASGHARAG